MPKRPGTLFVLSGPAGVGKDSLLEIVLHQIPGMKKSISMTTRAPLNQQYGQAYYFVSEEEFARLRDANGLLEYAEVHGNWYGTPAQWVREQLEAGRDVILNIDVQGGLMIREKCDNVVLIFVAPPSIDELARRLGKRGRDSESEIQRRLHNAAGEIEMAREYDFTIVNDDLYEAAEELKGIIDSVREERPGTHFL